MSWRRTPPSRRPAITGDFRLTCPSRPESLEEFHALFARLGEQRPDVHRTDLMLLETAVVEIVGNVIEHGVPSGRVEIALVLTVTDTDLDVVIHETGEPPPTAPSYAMPAPDSERGRGLPLCAAILDTFDYRRIDGTNVWRMIKARTA